MNVKYDFSGKTAVVTGAASGIGEGIALAFAESGTSVAILDINMEKGQETAAACEKLGVKAKAFLADITSEESLQSAREGVLETFGTVDFLISHAGVAKVPGLKTNPFTPPIKNLPLEHWEILMDYNLFGAVRVTNAFLDILKDKKDGSGIYGVGCRTQSRVQEAPLSCGEKRADQFLQKRRSGMRPLQCKRKRCESGMGIHSHLRESH